MSNTNKITTHDTNAGETESSTILKSPHPLALGRQYLPHLISSLTEMVATKKERGIHVGSKSMSRSRSRSLGPITEHDRG